MNQVSPWSVKGVDPECREAAKVAARKAGMTLGNWLSRTIMQQASMELRGGNAAGAGSNGRAAGPGSAPGDNQLPSLPTEELIAAIRRLSDDMREKISDELRTRNDQLRNDLKSDLRGQNREIAEEVLRPVSRSVQGMSQGLQGLNQKFEGVDQRFDGVAKKVESVNDRFSGMEQKFDRVTDTFDMLDKKLEGFEDVAGMAERMATTQQKADRAALSVAPLERTVMRMAERLDQIDEPVAMRRERDHRGFFARLFGG